MDGEQIVVVRLSGSEATVERYRCELVASSRLPASSDRLKEVVAGTSPLAVVWSAADEHGRALAHEVSRGRYLTTDVDGRVGRTPTWLELSEELGSLRDLLAALSAFRPTDAAHPPAAETVSRPAARGAPEAREPSPTTRPPGKRGSDLGASLDRVLAARARRGAGSRRRA